MANLRPPAGAEADDFFLPDLCQAQSILFLVLVAELLVFVMVLVDSSLVDFDWMRLGLASLLVQWIVLVSAGILCNLRPLLSSLSTLWSTVIGYGVILMVTLIFSIVAERLLMESSWTLLQTGGVARNLIVAAVMAGIAFRYFFLQHQLRRQEQAELASRIQALQSRIRPHFLFNSMNIIASLIEVDPETAEEVVEDLSALFRASLNDSSDQPLPLAEELELCEKYVHIESLRLDDRLEVDWRINADTRTVKIPLLTLQPVLENAIYHGIQPNPEGGTVTVTIDELDDAVEIRVANPVFREEFSHATGNRMAIDNIRRRLEAIYGGGASITTQAGSAEYVTCIRYPTV